MVIFQKWYLIKPLVSATRPNLASRNHITKDFILKNLFSAGYIEEGFFLLFTPKKRSWFIFIPS